MQIRCGDLYASPAVEEFTKCAVSEKGCVPQRQDNKEYPIPPDRDLVNEFDLKQFQVGLQCPFRSSTLCNNRGKEKQWHLSVFTVSKAN